MLKLGPRDLKPHCILILIASSLHPRCILVDEDATDGDATDADATDAEATDDDATDDDAMD